MKQPTSTIKMIWAMLALILVAAFATLNPNTVEARELSRPSVEMTSRAVSAVSTDDTAITNDATCAAASAPKADAVQRDATIQQTAHSDVVVQSDSARAALRQRTLALDGPSTKQAQPRRTGCLDAVTAITCGHDHCSDAAATACGSMSDAMRDCLNNSARAHALSQWVIARMHARPPTATTVDDMVGFCATWRAPAPAANTARPAPPRDQGLIFCRNGRDNAQIDAMTAEAREAYCHGHVVVRHGRQEIECSNGYRPAEAPLYLNRGGMTFSARAGWCAPRSIAIGSIVDEEMVRRMIGEGMADLTRRVGDLERIVSAPVTGLVPRMERAENDIRELQQRPVPQPGTTVIRPIIPPIVRVHLGLGLDGNRGVGNYSSPHFMLNVVTLGFRIRITDAWHFNVTGAGGASYTPNNGWGLSGITMGTFYGRLWGTNENSISLGVGVHALVRSIPWDPNWHGDVVQYGGGGNLGMMAMIANRFLLEFGFRAAIQRESLLVPPANNGAATQIMTVTNGGLGGFLNATVILN